MQVDWVSGFIIAKGRLHFEVVLTPVLRCFDGDSNYARSSAAVRMRVPPIRRAAPLQAVQRCAIGNLVYDDGTCSHVASKDRGEMHDARPTRHEWRVVDLQDSNSNVLTFDSLERESPISNLILECAPCPPHTAFFVINEENLTIAIPTSEVLIASYAPTHTLFSEFVAGARTVEAFLSDDIKFDGFAFVRRPYKTYPFRAQRNAKRAIFELQQLLPRACAYARRYDAMPLIIRPPFTGQVAIGGSAVKCRVGTHEYILFVRGIKYTTVFQYLSRDRYRPLLNQLRFAPVLYDDQVVLGEVGAKAMHSLGRAVQRLDIHAFARGLQHLSAGSHSTRIWKYWQTLLYPNAPLAPPVGQPVPAPHTPELAKEIQQHLGL